MRFVSLVVFLMMASFVSAVSESDCSRFSDWKLGECENIFHDSSLDTEQQKDLFFNLLQEQSELGSFSTVFEWNKSLAFTQPPRSSIPASNGIIQNAWVKLLSVENSFLDLNSNEWLAKPSGRVFSNYGYSIVLPSGTQAGDCQTEYSFDSLNENLQTLLNGATIGNFKGASYNTSLPVYGALNFETDFSLSARLVTNHYLLKQHCVNNPWGSYCWRSCDFDSVEYRTDSLSLEDSFNAKSLVEDYKTSLLLEDSNSLKILTVQIDSDSLINDFKLFSNTGFFEFSEASFDLNSDADGVLFVTRKPELTEHVNGFLKLDSNFSLSQREITLGASSLENCQLTITASFEQIIQDCNYKTLKPASIKLSSDQNTLLLEASDASGSPLSSKMVNLSIGDQSSEVFTNSQGQATLAFNPEDSKGLITARFKDSEYSGAGTLRIAQTNSQALNTLFEVFGFLAGYYFIFLVARHCFRKVF